MKINAPAKINLTLEALKLREDGYHEVISVLQAIDLCDELELEENRNLELICDNPELNNEHNLVIKAFRLLQKKTGINTGLKIILRKSIPVAAGLGGGSSDAAAVLNGLNRLWKLYLPAENLRAVAAELGSDVPFFIQAGTALAEGRGEIIKTLPSLIGYWFVLLLPPQTMISDKTARMYRSLKKANYTKGEITRSLARNIEAEYEIEDSLLYNVFDNLASGINPGLPEFRKILSEAVGTDKIHIAGSGPCLFAMFKNEERAQAVWHKLRGMNLTVFKCRTLPGMA